GGRQGAQRVDTSSVTTLLAVGDVGQAFGRNLSLGDWIAAGLILAAGLFWSLSVLGLRLGPLFGALGIGGLAVAFAAQSILANFLASIILQTRRPFRRGDQVTTNDCEGVVEEVNFRTVRLRTYSGERVLVPCAEVLAQPITNHTTLGRRRTTLEVGVGYDADLETTRGLLLAATESADGVLAKPMPEVWVKAFDESAVTLSIRFWHAPDQATLWRVRSQVAIAVKVAFDHAGVAIPFPQRMLSFASQLEASPATRVPE
ncbi:MAG: mechanosensitive ion channel family protein, partial [Actinomycetota bacterium]|nr:mechanosensitive ion channel family protein [Actinomycetota bacterium]